MPLFVRLRGTKRDNRSKQNCEHILLPVFPHNRKRCLFRQIYKPLLSLHLNARWPFFALLMTNFSLRKQKELVFSVAIVWHDLSLNKTLVILHNLIRISVSGDVFPSRYSTKTNLRIERPAWMLKTVWETLFARSLWYCHFAPFFLKIFFVCHLQ